MFEKGTFLAHKRRLNYYPDNVFYQTHDNKMAFVLYIHFITKHFLYHSFLDLDVGQVKIYLIPLKDLTPNAKNTQAARQADISRR